MRHPNGRQKMDDQTRTDNLRIEALRFAFADSTLTTAQARISNADAYLDFLTNEGAQA